MLTGAKRSSVRRRRRRSVRKRSRMMRAGWWGGGAVWGGEAGGWGVWGAGWWESSWNVCWVHPVSCTNQTCYLTDFHLTRPTAGNRLFFFRSKPEKLRVILSGSSRASRLSVCCWLQLRLASVLLPGWLAAPRASAAKSQLTLGRDSERSRRRHALPVCSSPIRHGSSRREKILITSDKIFPFKWKFRSPFKKTSFKCESCPNILLM